MGAQLSTGGDIEETAISVNEPKVRSDVPINSSERKWRNQVPSWLDNESAALVRSIVAVVAQHHKDLRAAILFGSVARHEERPLDDPEPSDVDLLLIFDLETELERLPLERRLAISHSIGLALDQHHDPPREVNVLTAIRDLADWDTTFVENIRRDGIVLWARDELPFLSVATAEWPQQHRTMR
jgi:predicted nucleotidyltransferase